MTVIVANYASSLNSAGSSIYAKSPATLRAPASTTKVITAYTARRWITNGMLSGTATVVATDLVGGSTANLQAGDELTFTDLFHGAMMPSGNEAAMCLARTCGQIILTSESASGDPLARFLMEMSAQVSKLGWSGCVFEDPTGLSNNNRITASYLSDIMRVIDTSDPWLRSVMGTIRYAITVIGVNARTINIAHTIDPVGAVKFPEFVAGKTGTTDAAGACVVMLWDKPNGSRQATTILGSTAVARYTDLRSVMDAIMSNGVATPSTTWVKQGGFLVQVMPQKIQGGKFINV